MANTPQKPEVQVKQWINGQTKLNQSNLTSGVNQNISNLKTAVDGVIDALGGPGQEPMGEATLNQETVAEYDSASTYNKGDLALNGGVCYRCQENEVTGEWNASKWSVFPLYAEAPTFTPTGIYIEE